MNSWSDWDKHHALCLAKWGYTRRNNARVRYYIREINLLVMENRAQQRELKALKEKKAMETGEIETDDEKDKMIEEADGIIESLQEQVQKYRAKAEEAEGRAKVAEEQVQQLLKKLESLENATQTSEKDDRDLPTKRKSDSNMQHDQDFRQSISDFVRKHIQYASPDSKSILSTQSIKEKFCSSGFSLKNDTVFFRYLHTQITELLPEAKHTKNKTCRGYTGIVLIDQ